MDYALFIDWIERVFDTFSDIGSWLITPITLIENNALNLHFTMAPIWIISGTGLTAFIVVAMATWLIDGIGG